MIKYGTTARGTKRWRCMRCGITGVMRKRANHYHRQFRWFQKWITEGFTVKQLVAESGHSRWMIQGTIAYWLAHSPTVSTIVRTGVCLFDGTYLDRSNGLLAMMGAGNTIVAGAYGLSERPNDLYHFFRSVADRGFSPASATVDGNRAVIRALREQWPEVIIQRCLVHVQRQGLMWCRRFPKRLDARKLRVFFLTLTDITTVIERDRWLTQLASWEARYGIRIAASRETGWVFSDLKRARSMLLLSLPNLFHYLNCPEIPRTTNALEGYFGRLKDRYHDHRGLARANRAGYFQWYLYLCPR